MFAAIAIHYPHPDHADAFVRHMRLVVDTTSSAEGLLSFECVRDEDAKRLIGLSRWRSREDFEAARSLIAANANRRRPEWTVADDELLLLEEL